RKTTRSSLAQALLFSPMLAAELGAVGVRPDAFPAVFAGGIERKTCCIAVAVGYRHEILVADAGADIARAGDVPGHAVGITGALHRDGAAIARAAARVVPSTSYLPSGPADAAVTLKRIAVAMTIKALCMIDPLLGV